MSKKVVRHAANISTKKIIQREQNRSQLICQIYATSPFACTAVMNHKTKSEYRQPVSTAPDFQQLIGSHGDVRVSHYTMWLKYALAVTQPGS